jgi:hypothetical protein
MVDCSLIVAEGCAKQYCARQARVDGVRFDVIVIVPGVPSVALITATASVVTSGGLMAVGGVMSFVVFTATVGTMRRRMLTAMVEAVRFGVIIAVASELNSVVVLPAAGALRFGRIIATVLIVAIDLGSGVSQLVISRPELRTTWATNIKLGLSVTAQVFSPRTNLIVRKHVLGA